MPEFFDSTMICNAETLFCSFRRHGLKERTSVFLPQCPQDDPAEETAEGVGWEIRPQKCVAEDNPSHPRRSDGYEKWQLAELLEFDGG